MNDSYAVRKNNLLCFPFILWTNNAWKTDCEVGQLKGSFGCRLVSAVKDASTREIFLTSLAAVDGAHQLLDTTADFLRQMLVKIQTEGVRSMMTKMPNQ